MVTVHDRYRPCNVAYHQIGLTGPNYWTVATEDQKVEIDIRSFLTQRLIHAGFRSKAYFHYYNIKGICSA